MPGVGLSGLLAAAMVSAAVTFGVEWLAKPRLEARKERILRRCRAKDEVWRTLDRILYWAAVMKTPQSRTGTSRPLAARLCKVATPGELDNDRPVGPVRSEGAADIR